MWKKREKERWRPEISQVIAGAISLAWQDRLDRGISAPMGDHIEAFTEAIVDAISYEFDEREDRISWLELQTTKMSGILAHLAQLHKPMQNRGASNTTKLDGKVVFGHETPIRRVCQECGHLWPCPNYDVVRKFQDA